MKLYKRMLAFGLAAAMILGTAGTAFAVEGETEPVAATAPTSTDPGKGNISVTGIEAEDVDKAKVTAYKIVKPTFADEETGAVVNGVTGWKLVDGIHIADLEADPKVTDATIKQSEIYKIAQQIGAKEVTPFETVTLNNPDFKAEVTPGMWIVVATGTGTTIYNPVIVSVNYDNAMDITTKDGTISFGDEYSDTAVMKSSTIPVIKKAKNKTDGDEEKADGKATDAEIGDIISFSIDTTIPAYGAAQTTTKTSETTGEDGTTETVTEYVSAYTHPKFEISDAVTKGLEIQTDTIKLQASDDGTSYEDVDTKNYTVDPKDTGKFTIKLKEDYIVANPAKEVRVVYEALVTEDADYNFDEETNTGKVTFSNDPTDEKSVGEEEDKTYHYTFAINAELDKDSESQLLKKKTTDVVKVNDKGEVIAEISSDKQEETITMKDGKTPVENAVFMLCKDKAGKQVFKDDLTTNKDGYLTVNGLDADTTYYLIEKTAPKGYSLSTKITEVKIEAKYNENGTLASYTIFFDGAAINEYKATYSQTDPEVVEKVEYEQFGIFSLVNTPLPELPSTGGMGTTIFYVLGSMLAVGAAVLLVVRRRMGSEN